MYSHPPHLYLLGPPSALAAATGDEALDALRHASMRCGGCGAKV